VFSAEGQTDAACSTQEHSISYTALIARE